MAQNAIYTIDFMAAVVEVATLYISSQTINGRPGFLIFSQENDWRYWLWHLLLYGTSLINREKIRSKVEFYLLLICRTIYMFFDVQHLRFQQWTARSLGLFFAWRNIQFLWLFFMFGLCNVVQAGNVDESDIDPMYDLQFAMKRA